MITATTPSLPSSQNPIPLASCPPPATMFQPQLRPTATSSEQFASSLLLHCKDHPNVFNTIQPLFSAFFSANPLFSTTSSLFFAKQGGGGSPMLPKFSGWAAHSVPLPSTVPVPYNSFRKSRRIVRARSPTLTVYSATPPHHIPTSRQPTS
jgi:hypothetical protein